MIITSIVVRVVRQYNLSIKEKTASGLRNLQETSQTKRWLNFLYRTLSPALIQVELWIGEMIREGEGRYTDWKKRTQSLSYLFRKRLNVYLRASSTNVCKKMDHVIQKSSRHI